MWDKLITLNSDLRSESHDLPLWEDKNQDKLLRIVRYEIFVSFPIFDYQYEFMDVYFVH